VYSASKVNTNVVILSLSTTRNIIVFKTVGNSGGPQTALDNRYLFGKHLSAIGSTMGPVSDFETVMKLVFDGHLKAVIDSVYRLEDSLAALHRLADGELAGKLILKP
jgi:zinc-binding alcohol dehydrogenase/oxidoreductase